MARIDRAGARVAALSVDSIKQSAALKKKLQLPFDLLCDQDKRVIAQYHLLNPHEHDGIAYPAVFVIIPEGTIVYRSLDRTARRVKLDAVLGFLDRLAADPAALEEQAIPRSTIIPSPITMVQVMRNMISNGSIGDWKHYLKFTFVYAPRGAVRALTGIIRSGRRG